MVQKPIIHMQLADEKTPFDISLYRAIKFSRTRPSDIRAAEAALGAQVAEVIKPEYQVENPVTRARGAQQILEHATPAQQVLLEAIRALQQRVSLMEEALQPLQQRASLMEEVRKSQPDEKVQIAINREAAEYFDRLGAAALTDKNSSLITEPSLNASRRSFRHGVSSKKSEKKA